MTLHPRATHWFVSYVPRHQLVYAMEALAASGQVELEQDLLHPPFQDSSDLQHSIRTLDRLIGRYAELLPVPSNSHAIVTARPEASARLALADIRGWLAGQLGRRRHMTVLRRKLRDLRLLRECLDAMGGEAQMLLNFSGMSPFLCERIYACPQRGDGPLFAPDPEGISEVYIGPEHRFHVVVCLPEKGEIHDYTARRSHCERVGAPDGLLTQRSTRGDRIGREIAALTAQIAALDDLMVRHRADPQLADALNVTAVLRWYLDHRVTVTEDGRYCYITGWTTAANPQPLQAVLQSANIDAVILFRPSPPNRVAPVSLAGGWLARPFRVFGDMLGTVGPRELDPAPLLSVLVPVLFGMMFPDVGHGLVLAIVSLALSRRYPRLRFLIPCGLAASGFGVLFGEVFGSHELLPALWLSPLEQPLFVLLASLLLGAGIILLGVALSGIEAHWRGELRTWLWLDGAILALYLSVLAGFVDRHALVFAGLALPWYLIGLLVTGAGPVLRRLGAGLGRLLHSALELMLNTLSFLRVGAFALAHTALAHAVLQIAELIDQPALQWAALVVGHTLIMLIEGMVVFVQTTRLILFEFFIRFLHADGRLFRPMAAPEKTFPTGKDTHR